MLRRTFLAIVWLVFLVYAFRLAPPDQPDTAHVASQAILDPESRDFRSRIAR